MKRSLFIAAVMFVLFVAPPVHAAFGPGSPFLVSWEHEPIRVRAGESFETTVVIRMPPGHYIYADKTELEFTSLEGLRVDEIVYPGPDQKEDEFLGHTVPVFMGEVVI